MAVTVSIAHDIQLAEGATEHLYTGTINPGTYATGGVVVDAPANSSLEVVFTDHQGGYVTAWSQGSQKLLVYRQKDPAAAGGADIPLPEVANATDLSGVTFNFWAIGQ